MKSRLPIKSLLVAFCLGMALLLTAVPSRAGVNLDLGGINLLGTLLGAGSGFGSNSGSGSTAVTTPFGNVQVPSQVTQFLVNQGLNYLQSQVPGTALGGSSLPTNATTLQGAAASAAAILLGNGSITSLPINGSTTSLPVPIAPIYTQPNTQSNTPSNPLVNVRLTNGNVIQMPLNTALILQQAQGGTILTSATPDTVVQPSSASLGIPVSSHWQGKVYGRGYGQGYQGLNKVHGQSVYGQGQVNGVGNGAVNGGGLSK